MKEKLLPKNDINKALGLDIALSSDMANAIQGWLNIAENKPRGSMKKAGYIL